MYIYMYAGLIKMAAEPEALSPEPGGARRLGASHLKRLLLQNFLAMKFASRIL